MSEIALGGGRVTPGVVRVGDTVRRPAKGNTPFVRILFAELAECGFDAAPRYLGRDEQGRENVRVCRRRRAVSLAEPRHRRATRLVAEVRVEIAAREQARRITVFCDAYGIAENIDIVETIANAISRNLQRLREQRRPADVRWWQAQLHWVERNRVELTLG